MYTSQSAHMPLTVFVSGIPHRVTEDNIYNGFFIPAGSMVFANIWYVQTFSSPLFKERVPLKCAYGI